MLPVLFIFGLIGCMGLIAALRPDVYVRYFLAKYQRRALSRNPRALSLTGWAIFAACMVVIIALPFQSKWYVLAPVFGPLFDLVCAAAYIWWGIGLLRRPNRFLERASDPWARLPAWAIQGFGLVLLVGAAGFLYGFAERIKAMLR
jgi:hypothetical protein